MSGINHQVTFVDSSTITSWSYRPEEKILTVIFKSGKSYTYQEVDVDSYINFIKEAFESPGKSLNKNIKGNFSFVTE